MEILSSHFRKTKSHSKEDIALTLGPFSTEYFAISLPEKSRHHIVEACRFKDMPIKILKSTNLDRSRSEETFICDEACEVTEEFIIDDDSE